MTSGSDTWGDLGVRVVAVRSRDRDNGKQLYLWNNLDMTVQAYLTNDWTAPLDEIAPGPAGARERAIGAKSHLECSVSTPWCFVSGNGGRPFAPLLRV